MTKMPNRLRERALEGSVRVLPPLPGAPSVVEWLWGG